MVKIIDPVDHAKNNLYRFQNPQKSRLFSITHPHGYWGLFNSVVNFIYQKKGWYKYAGNWNQKKPPLGYALQRTFLKNQSRVVTINGRWPNQPTHCLTFENPCLTNADRAIGMEVIKNKSYLLPYSFCFVGRLEDEKGYSELLTFLLPYPINLG